jgi:hypothetical protein
LKEKDKERHLESSPQRRKYWLQKYAYHFQQKNGNQKTIYDCFKVLKEGLAE